MAIYCVTFISRLVMAPDTKKKFYKKNDLYSAIAINISGTKTTVILENYPQPVWQKINYRWNKHKYKVVLKHPGIDPIHSV